VLGRGAQRHRWTLGVASVGGEDASSAFGECNYVVGVLSIAHFHSRASGRHPGNGQAAHFILVLQKFPDFLGWNVSLYHIVTNDGRVTGSELAADPMFAFNGLHELCISGLNVKACIFHAIDPQLAAAAAWRFENGHGLAGVRDSSGRRSSDCSNQRGTPHVFESSKHIYTCFWMLEEMKTKQIDRAIPHTRTAAGWIDIGNDT